jgi:hypothetical protein
MVPSSRKVLLLMVGVWIVRRQENHPLRSITAGP